MEIPSLSDCKGGGTLSHLLYLQALYVLLLIFNLYLLLSLDCTVPARSHTWISSLKEIHSNVKFAFLLA